MILTCSPHMWPYGSSARSCATPLLTAISRRANQTAFHCNDCTQETQKASLCDRLNGQIALPHRRCL